MTGVAFYPKEIPYHIIYVYAPLTSHYEMAIPLRNSAAVLSQAIDILPWIERMRCCDRPQIGLTATIVDHRILLSCGSWRVGGRD